MKYSQLFQSFSHVVLVSSLTVLPLGLPIVAQAKPIDSYGTTRHNLMKNRSNNSDRPHQSTSTDSRREQIDNSSTNNNGLGGGNINNQEKDTIQGTSDYQRGRH